VLAVAATPWLRDTVEPFRFLVAVLRAAPPDIHETTAYRR
jgi:hypothetical protein